MGGKKGFLKNPEWWSTLALSAWFEVRWKQTTQITKILFWFLHFFLTQINKFLESLVENGLFLFLDLTFEKKQNHLGF